MNPKEILCQDTAFKNFFLELKRRGFLSTFPLNEYNHKRHRLIKADDKKYYVIYKRDFYNTFGKEFEGIFTKYPELEGLGESINKDSLFIAINQNVDAIVFIHPEGMYKVFPALIKVFCEKNDLIRTQDKYNTYKGLNGFIDKKQEATYSFPAKLLERF